MAKQPQPTFSEELIRAKAYLIYLQQKGKGISASPEENWQRAIDELKQEEKKGTQNVLGRIALVLLWPVRYSWLSLEKETNREKVKIIISLLGLGATVAAAIGLYLNYQDSLLEREASREERQLSRAQLKVSEARQITDRFAKAIELLKDKDVTVRIGAMFALERLSKDSPNDHWTIIELLSRFVAEKTKKNGNSFSNKISADVQAALTIIGRRETQQDPDGYSLSLPGTTLIRAKLLNSNLDLADLSRSDIKGANLSGASLRNADLSGSNLSYASLNATNDGKDIRDFILVIQTLDYFITDSEKSYLSYLKDTGLKITDLSFANLADANLSYSKLYFANLSASTLDKANLKGAELNGAYLGHTKFRNANLAEAYLIYANLNTADLSGANLSGADLTEANLSNANLQKANLSGANLTSANLSKTYLQGAIVSSKTKLPTKWKLIHKLVNEGGEGSNYSGADLSDANFFESNFSKANLSKANLSNSNFSLSNFSETNFSEANLSNSSLDGSNLSKANLSKANLSFAVVKFSNFSYANLSEANLIGVNFDDAKICKTKLPNFLFINSNRDCKELGIDPS